MTTGRLSPVPRWKEVPSHERSDPAGDHDRGNRPEELSAAQARREQYERNAAWLEAHAKEVYSQRGKVFCIAGEELFVGDAIQEVLARARAAHPDDGGLFTGYIPLNRAARICAC
jgi:hypothetical protein